MKRATAKNLHSANGKKNFLCAVCGVKIYTNKSNLARHEQTHKTEIQKISCGAEKCEATFKQKSDYFRHWHQKHSDMVMPDGLNYVNEKNIVYKRKYHDKFSSKNTYSPKFNDFLVLNYLGLIENRRGSINLKYPQPDQSFGKMVFEE